MASGRYKIVIIGAGGHARVVASILEYYRNYEVIGIADRGVNNLGELICRHKIISSWKNWQEWKDLGVTHVVLAIGENRERACLYGKMISEGFEIPMLIHPKAIVEKGASLGNGTLVCVGAVVCAESRIGENTIVNTGAIIDHEVKIGKHVHIAPGAIICGRVEVGDYSFIGAGARIIDKKRIGSNVVIGAGAVVIDDIADDVTAVGIPARVVSRNSDDGRKMG